MSSRRTLGNRLPRPLSRRAVLRLFGVGAASASVVGSGRWLGASAPPGPTVPAPTLPIPPMQPQGVPTIAELAAELEWDVGRIFRYVADEIAYDAYPGALRGANGTLWGKAGNSVDQSLLLAALLDEAVVPWRFAVGALDEEVAGAVLATSVGSVVEAKRRLADVLLPADVAESWSGDGRWTRAAELDALLDTLHRRVGDTVTMIEEALDAAGVAVAMPENALPARERTQHVWVQYADGPDWIDLDPAVADAALGTAYATPEDTPTELPAELYHTVTIRVASEVVSGGAPVRADLVTHTARSADVGGVPIHLVHPGAEWLGVASAITGTEQYVPTLLVGEQVVEGTVFGLSTGAGVVGALGGESEAEGQTVAEWVEFEVSVPDQPVRTASRVLFDRLDPQRRRAGATEITTLEPVELVDAGGEAGSAFVPLAGVLTITVTGHALPWSYFADEPESLDEVSLLAPTAHAFHYVRDVARLDSVAERPYWFAVDEPNIAAFWMNAGEVTPAPVGSAADASAGSDPSPVGSGPADVEAPVGTIRSVFAAVDIVHAHHAIRAIDGTAPPTAGVLAAAIDHAAERLLFDGALPAGDADDFASVGRIFELAADAGVPIVTLLPGGTSSIPDLGAPAVARIEQALEAGRVVIVPERPVTIGNAPRSGWWEVDPATGHTLDRLDDGRGAELGEYLLFIHELATWAMCITALGYAIVAVVRAAWKEAVTAGAVGAGMCIAAGGGGVPHFPH